MSIGRLTDPKVVQLRPHRAVFRGELLALLLLASACGKDNPSGNTNPSTGSIDPVGTFQVSLVAPQGTTPGFTSVLGRLQEGPTPSAIIWEEAAASGDCRLLTPRTPFCDPLCGSDALCVEDGQCGSFPAVLTAGTVQVDGLQTVAGETTFSMDPIAGNYQPTGGVSLPFPAFSEGDDITFGANGSEAVSPFAVTARGISPLEVMNETIELAGEPVLLEWTPPWLTDITTISVVFDISYHGGPRGKVVCDCPDSGSLDVSAALLEQLKALGISGFPKMEIARRAVGSTEPPASVDLVVESTVTMFVDIPGVVSCNADRDCPRGQTCGFDFRCR